MVGYVRNADVGFGRKADTCAEGGVHRWKADSKRSAGQRSLVDGGSRFTRLGVLPELRARIPLIKFDAMVPSTIESVTVTGGTKAAEWPLVRRRDDWLSLIVRRLATTLSLPAVMEVVARTARLMMHADGISLVLRDGDLCHYAEEDAIAPLWKGRRFPMSACISGWCMITGQAVSISDIYEDERIPHDAYRPTFVRSLAMVPVPRNNPIAALGAYWAETYDASIDDLELLQMIADAAAPAIQQVRG